MVGDTMLGDPFLPQARRGAPASQYIEVIQSKYPEDLNLQLTLDSCKWFDDKAVATMISWALLTWALMSCKTCRKAAGKDISPGSMSRASRVLRSVGMSVCRHSSAVLLILSEMYCRFKEFFKLRKLY